LKAPSSYPWRALSATTLAVAAGMLAAALGAAPAQAGITSSAEPREVRLWLMRIHNAAGQRNFQGTFVVSAAGNVSSARIAHFYEGAHQFERIEPLDGQARHVLRHDSVVHTLWPLNKVALVERRDVINSFPSLLLDGDDRIVDFYEVLPQKSERVAGHDANVLLLKPRDGFRYGHRLWAETQSGLLLRSEVLNERGDVLEVSAFSEVSIGVRSQPELVLQPMRKQAGYRIVKPVLLPTQLSAEGWGLRHNVAGFRQLSCVRRPLDLLGSADPKVPATDALQTVFTDGITYVSVFIEPYDAQRHVRPATNMVGATQTMTSRHGDFWLTVVGDVPTVTLRAFVAAFERSK
jgi:sigma-E factor negative regulatory protein RseB